jgi:phytol kinase
LTSKFRTAVHAGALLVPILAEATSRLIVLTILIGTTIIYIISEELRSRGKRVPLLTRFTLKMSSETETGSFVTAPIYLAVGVILSLIIFREDIAYASITIVAVGDPAAAYIGRRFGRLRVREKTLEGFAAGVIASFVAALLWTIPILAVAGALAGMLLELLEILDDNLAIPIGAGIAMFIVSLL